VRVNVKETMRVLRSKRLRLEPLEESHADALFESLRHPSLYEFISERPPLSVAALRRRYRRLAGLVSPDGRHYWLNWAIYSHAAGRYVGYVQATLLHDRSAYVAGVVFREAWGSGYAREALAAVIEYLHEDWGTTLVRATVDTDNLRSIRLLESLGFQRRSVRESAQLIHGMASDEADYSLQRA
jgi:RimJ/RimL family protein N-acetyltransferase